MVFAIALGSAFVIVIVISAIIGIIRNKNMTYEQFEQMQHRIKRREEENIADNIARMRTIEEFRYYQDLKGIGRKD